MTEGLEAVVRRCSVKNVFLKLRKMCRKKINPSSLFERLSLQFYKETPREKKNSIPYTTPPVLTRRSVTKPYVTICSSQGLIWDPIKYL